MRILKRCWSSMNIAFSMYSKIPAAQCDWSEENMKYVMCFFPWVGIVIGLLVFGWDQLAAFLNVRDALRNAVLLVIPVAVTGGIHLDGFLDTSDAMSSWRPMEKRLEILKDSHAGAFAIICGIVYFFLLYGVLDSVQGDMVAVYACCFAVSRSFSAFSVVTFPKASAKGTVAGFSKTAETRVIQATSICYILLTGGIMLLLQPVYGVAALLGAVLSFIWYYHRAMKYFGGINGDLAGYFLTVCELVMPLMIVIAPQLFTAVQFFL
ncbi:MAG: adenosylcobinamide-GDP ribazoletransferase [Lachnospiraceae bacterium]|nr:adenosylcobinamide-GDP ribazoletransferase [Lachnospiraceae bacterium]